MQAVQISKNIHALKHIFSIPVKPEVNLDRLVYSFIIFNNDDIHLIDSGDELFSNGLI
ncbi:MAG: hypothetical protein WAM24_09235 [Ignavibacteriaceae bacterium]